MKYMNEEKIMRIKERQYANRLKSYKRHLINQQEKKDRFYVVNRNLQLIETSNRLGSLRNCLRWHSNETKEHILKKLELCMELKSMGHEFLTEAKFKTGGRCDVIDLTDGTIYEVLHTETDEMFEAKVQKYPREFSVVKVNCGKQSQLSHNTYKSAKIVGSDEEKIQFKT